MQTTEDSRSESKLWKEFHSHFNKKNRDRGVKVNHHDFLELPNVGRFSLGRFGLMNKESFIEEESVLSPADAIFAGPAEKL